MFGIILSARHEIIIPNQEATLILTPYFIIPNGLTRHPVAQPTAAPPILRICATRGNKCQTYLQSKDSVFFYSNDNAPVHVHVQHGGSEAVFEILGGAVTLKESVGVKVSERKRAEGIAVERMAEMERKWHERFG